MSDQRLTALGDEQPSRGDGDVDVLVIGGGQAALAVGYYLQRAQRRGSPLSFALLDAARSPGGAWSSGWDTLQLFSPAGYSSLPGWPMPAWTGGGNPSAEHVQSYLDAYEQRYALPVYRPVRVSSVTQGSLGGFSVYTDDTDHAAWTCRVLMNATGTWGRPFWPTYPGMAEFAGWQLHTADYVSADQFDDQTVVVVGGANSGAQIVADLLGRSQGQTVWVTARQPRFLPDDVDGRTLFELATRRVQAAATGVTSEAGVGGLGDIVMVPSVLAARRRGELIARPIFDRLTGTGVRWDDPPAELDADAIVWCTGFRPELRHLNGLSLTRHDGLPATERALPTRSIDQGRLYLLGYGDWCGPASATLIGVGALAQTTVDAITSDLADLR